MRLNFDLVSKLSFSKPLRSRLELLQGPGNLAPHECPTHQRDGQHRDPVVNPHDLAALGELHVSLCQRHAGIQHAENLLAGGMRVTRRIRAGRLVFDGRDDSQHAVSTPVAVDTEAVWPVQT